MFYLVQNKADELYKITEGQYKEIKSTTDFDHSLINPLTCKQEWINPEIGGWEAREAEEIEDLDT